MTLRLSLLLLGAGTLGACATFAPEAPEGPPVASAADRHVIAVEQTSERLEIVVAAGDSSLSSKSRADLQALAGRYLRFGHGALILSAPAGGANAAAAETIAQQAHASLVEAGVSYAAVAASTYDAVGESEAPVVVAFARFEAHAPECAPLWAQDLAHQSNNQPWGSFGCATQANLAALVEDPHDLLAPRGEDPRSADRRTTVLEAYAAGEVTHAERSEQEHVAVSDAVR